MCSSDLESTSAYVTEVLPAELLISFGMAAVFVPASSTALVGVAEHDAGIASAVLNTAQQVGGSLGLALQSAVYASAVTGHLAGHPGEAPGAALVHGYHVAFVWAAGFLAVALVIGALAISAKKDDLPAEAAMAV